VEDAKRKNRSEDVLARQEEKKKKPKNTVKGPGKRKDQTVRVEEQVLRSFGRGREGRGKVRQSGVAQRSSANPIEKKANKSAMRVRVIGKKPAENWSAKESRENKLTARGRLDRGKKGKGWYMKKQRKTLRGW